MKNIAMNTFVLKRADKQDLLESALLLKLPNKEQRILNIFENIQYEAVLSAISYASETFINMVDLEESIIAVLEKLGKATGVSRIQLFKNIIINNEEHRLEVLHEWVDENCKKGKENSMLSGYSYSSLGLQRWEEILSRGDFIAGAPFEFDKAEKDSLLLYDIKYVLVIPVFVGKEFWGFIKYDNFVCERRMTETEINALYSVGQTLGAAIQKINFEKEIIIAKDAAEKSDRLKTEFLAQMSHEIRTPINSILCFTSLLESELIDKIPDELKSCFDAIDNGGRRLIRTIDMILNMSQFQTDNYEANYQIIDLNNGFLENILEEFKPASQAKGLIIDFIRTDIEAYVLADPYTLEQIFSNLLDNAIKFTNHGQIAVSIYQNIDSSICVDVSDTGVGISNEYIPNLFTPFSQEEMGYTRKFEGNGLGLALVKKYLEINRASILVDSKKGIGSTFTVLFRNN